MATRIVLLGGECTGKSSLAAALNEASQARVVPEYLRAFVDEHGRTPDQDEQLAIWQAQREAFDLAVRGAAASDLVVCDPAPVMTAVYSLQYFQDRSLFDRAVSDESFGADLWVWCQPDVPWTSDGKHRDGPQAREKTHMLIEQQVFPLITDGHVIRAFGSTAQRFRAVLAALS